ncbi:DNA polymerase/3'-5' exonuclease PolX [Polaromonas naphthalenivorans]|uniref:DNA polymerase beta n=1 Tax=Polaromonas naphthalenivorans (strain CJ2) TaxID=365044 RepID=A1VKG1_POLNA|nr:DNA polymerase/3'-5' exonuclease PolX [Polaromonas naphthalenivorans]ABM36139.1 PHP C-terminal domain protein [Polaromonas naphthalenivorans CJ2]
MPIQNAEIAAVLNEIADLLDIQEANPFRIRAYRNAARTVGEAGRSVPAMVARQADLDALPGIGPDLAGKITEIVNTGSCALLERLRKELPPGITELLKVPGLGPKRVRALYHDLGVQTLAQLHLAAQEGRVQAIAGFGPKTQQALLEATAARLRQERRFPLGVADETAAALLAGLAAVPGVARAVAAGSLRRRRETVGDLDLLVSLSGDSAVMAHFIQGEDGRQVLLHGGTRASVVLKSGLQVDLRAVPAQSLGAAWVYFTGSKAHNIALRRLAQEQGLKVNEYGVFRGAERIAGATEASLYQALGLRYIEPELREDRGEIEAARQDRLPVLVSLADLRGDLHLHTRDSDGRDSLEAMAAAARARGWRYAAVTDHSRSPAFARGLDPVRLAKQIDRIDRFNEKAQGFTVLKGIEVDILQDGTLELPDSILQRLDLVVGAVHHHLDLPRARQTERVLRAMDSRYFTLLAHPTGRLIGERAPCEIDLLRVLRKARERGCFVELNAQPARLDLADTACQMAKAEGVLVSINSDAHGTLEFNHLPSGIDQGRRGWLEKADVLNTRDLPELRPLLARTMG